MTSHGLDFRDGGPLKCGFKLEWVEKPTVDKLLAGGPIQKDLWVDWVHGLVAGLGLRAVSG